MGVQELSVPVLIVGGGPTGLAASILCSNLGIAHLLVERRTQPQQAPAAHVINRRTLEILRQAGLPMESLYALDRHATDQLLVRWGANLQGPTLGEFRLGATPEDLARQASYSRERLSNISQPLFEGHLATEADRRSPGALCFGHEWKRFCTEDLSCSEIADTDGTIRRVRASYVLAADGAGSPIRRALGIRTRGADHVATFLSLSCEVDRTKAGGSPGALLDWCLEPRLSGVVVTHDPHKLAVYMRQLHEPYESLDNFDDETCRGLLTHLFGAGVPFRLLNKGVWRMTAQVAERFRQGPVFLIGDSAHRFPPTGGLGLNSGVADAHNLVWKIAAQLNNGASVDLLDSYEAERMPVVQRNRDVSLSNFLKMDEVLHAMGLDPALAPLPARILAAPLIRLLPKAVQSALHSLLTAPALKVLRNAEADNADGQERRAKIQRAIENQREHFDMPGLELGFVYRSGCAVSEVAAKTPEHPVVDYIPSTKPGERFPHVALLDEAATDGHADAKQSTLDYLCYDSYTLVHNGQTEEPVHHETFGLPLRRFDIRSVRPQTSDTSLSAALDLPAHAWILVRPDGHVAARSSQTDDGATDQA